MIAKRSILAVVVALVLSGAACKREERGFRVEPPSAQRPDSKSLSNLYPGPAVPPVHVVNEYEENAYALSEGKTLFTKYNCVGCHANGGGGIGPPLMDKKWIYGDAPENVYASIVEGRPNGMPSWRGRIPDYQVWQIVAFVRSMSGLVPKDAAPSRNDDMESKEPEAQRSPQEPRTSAEPSPGGGTQ